MDRWNNELENLFAEYKAAMPDPEPSAHFMPELWRKIEARQSFTLRLRKLTQLFVAAAAAFSLLLSIVEVVPSSRHPELTGTYVDILAEAHPADNLAGLGIRVDNAEANNK